MNIYLVQLQLSCLTLDGWQSSRQAKSLSVAADSPYDAAIELSNALWDVCPRANGRTTTGVVEARDTGVMWTVRIAYYEHGGWAGEIDLMKI